MTENGKNNPGINISISGGSGQFGAITQGNNNRVTSSVEATQGGVSPEDVKALRDELEALAEAKEISYSEMKAVQAKLAEMEELARSDGPVERIASVARSIHDNFGWAAKPLSAFLGGIL